MNGPVHITFSEFDAVVTSVSTMINDSYPTFHKNTAEEGGHLGATPSWEAVADADRTI
jgi:hypothetical protein